MDIEDRIEAFGKLGEYVAEIDGEDFKILAENAKRENPWFIEASIKSALEGVGKYLAQKSLEDWVKRYGLTPVNSKTVAVIMAGNIPLVGFHDFLAVLISGHSIQVKLSSKDTSLLYHLALKLIEIEPRFKTRITFADQLKHFDAIIATGSDNSSRYFNYYFNKYPHIIRKNRTSCAVINGKESENDLKGLGHDVFSYFGLGCRNVSKIFLPEEYEVSSLFQHWDSFKDIIHHSKYFNNYEYQKSILLINKIHFYDSGFVMLRQNENLVSPISVVYYETYKDEGSLALKLFEAKEKIQCIVGHSTSASVPFGQAQSPSLLDYADQIDTLKFLQTLN